MIKGITSISVTLWLLTCGLCFIEYFESMDVDIPYVETILWAVFGVLLLLLVLKINVRWQAILLGIKSNGFNLTLKGFRRVIVAEGVSLLYFFSVGTFLISFLEEIHPLAFLAYGYFVEGAAHLIMHVSKKPYKILLSDKAITKITNQLLFIRWGDLSKIDSRHNDIHFIDKMGRVTMFDTELIKKEDKQSFIAELNELARKKNIYCSIDCRRGYYENEDEVA